MTGLAFTAIGQPAPQGSHTAVVNPRTGRAQVLEGRDRAQRARHADWRSTVAQEAWVAMTRARRTTPFLGPVSVHLTFRLHRPTSANAAWRWQWKRPDIDKLTRAVLDSLTVAGVVADDGQVAELVVRKLLAAPGEALGVDVSVTALDHLEARLGPHSGGDAA